LGLVRHARAGGARDPVRGAPARPPPLERVAPRDRLRRRAGRRRSVRLRRLPAGDREAREPVHPASRGASTACNEVARFGLEKRASAVTKSLCSAPHGACGAPVVPARRGRHAACARHAPRPRRRCPHRLGRRLVRAGPDRRGGHRPARRCDRRLPPLPALLLMSGVFATPRPVPEGKVAALGGTAVVVDALPVFLLPGWRLGAWAIAAALWAAYQAIGLLLRRVRLGSDNLAPGRLVSFGRMTRAVALLAVLIPGAR